MEKEAREPWSVQRAKRRIEKIRTMLEYNRPNTLKIKKLILSTQDPEFINKCIEDGEIFGFDELETDITELALSTHDPKVMKKCIENREKLGMSSGDVVRLIEEIQDDKYTKKCIENRENFGFSSENIASLIAMIQDDKYIKKCITEATELGLTSSDIYHVLEYSASIKEDTDFLKYCVRNANTIGLSSDHICRLLTDNASIKEDTDFVKECIENANTIGLSSSDLYSIIDITCNRKNDIELLKGYVEKCTTLGLDSEHIRNLIVSTRDDDYIKSCISKAPELGLQPRETKFLVFRFGPKYIKESIEDREQLGLDSSTLTDMILATGDIEYIRQIVNGKANINLEESDIQKLTMFTQEKNIELPPEMTIGVEIEAENRSEWGAYIYEEPLFRGSGWHVKKDDSVYYGNEVVSPILTGDPSKSSDQIRSACAILNGLHQQGTDNCGGHVHIGADYLTSKQDWINLMQIWGNAEKVLYIISNQAGEISRDGILEHARANVFLD